MARWRLDWAARGGRPGGVNQRPQDRVDRQLQDPRRRYRLSRSTGCDSQRTHQLPHGTLQVTREGPPLPAWAVDACWPPPASPRLPESQGRASLRGLDQAAQHPKIAGSLALLDLLDPVDLVDPLESLYDYSRVFDIQ